MEIKIAVIVADNGNFAVTKFEGDETDWAICEDMIGAYDERSNDIIWPKAERRFVITAHVELPQPVEEVAASQVADHQ